MRADARKNSDAVLEAAKQVFAEAGVDAPAKRIADLAGVGVGTVYRHFPQRSDLVKAVFQQAVDACAARAPVYAAEYDPVEALVHWLERYTDFIMTKRGLAAALHSGDPAFNALPAYFSEHLGPALDGLLASAVDAGEIRDGLDSEEFLHAVSNLCQASGGQAPDYSQRMVRLIVDGLRFGAPAAARRA